MLIMPNVDYAFKILSVGEIQDLLFDKLCDIILYLFAVYLITDTKQRF